MISHRRKSVEIFVFCRYFGYCLNMLTFSTHFSHAAGNIISIYFFTLIFNIMFHYFDLSFTKEMNISSCTPWSRRTARCRWRRWGSWGRRTRRCRRGCSTWSATCQHMTGLLHEGIFHVRGLIKPVIFGSLPWAYVMCNWAQILICQRHWPSQ